MELSSELVFKKIIEVLCKRFLISELFLNENSWDLPLTGIPFNFTGIDLVYLLFEIESALDIRFDDQYFSLYGFSTLNKIIEVIIQCVNDRN